MFSPTPQDLTPVQQERRSAEEAMRQLTAALVARAGTQAADKGALIILGRAAREALAANTKAVVYAAAEAHGQDPLTIARAVRLSAVADGVALPATATQRRFTVAGARDMLAALKAGEVGLVIEALEEVLRG